MEVSHRFRAGGGAVFSHELQPWHRVGDRAEADETAAAFCKALGHARAHRQRRLIEPRGVAVVYGVPIGLAAGGEIGAGEVRFSADFTDEDRRLGVVNILKASASEASMMARCTGKTNLHNLEPEDLRALTLATAEATGIPLAGAR